MTKTTPRIPVFFDRGFKNEKQGLISMVAIEINLVI